VIKTVEKIVENIVYVTKEVVVEKPFERMVI
jgi:hypothetical protein